MSITCESCRIFYRGVPYNILDQKLGSKPKIGQVPTTDLADELWQRTQIF